MRIDEYTEDRLAEIKEVVIIRGMVILAFIGSAFVSGLLIGLTLAPLLPWP